jgi:hypothetical protein
MIGEKSENPVLAIFISLLSMKLLRDRGRSAVELYSDDYISEASA